MKKLLIIKHLAAAVILLAVIFSFSAGLSAQTVYKTLIELPTEASSGWKAANSVTLSAITVKKAEKAAVSFTSRDLTVDGEYRFSAQWGEFGVKAAEMVLKTDIFISDISILNSGAITLSADDGHGFSWRMTDLSLKSGWNSITLNLRTADIVRPPEKEETETEEETATEEEASTEEEPKKELTSDEILLSVNKFAFEAKKTQEKEMTVAFSGLSVSVPTKEEPPEPPKPITDDADKSLVTVAAVIAVVLIAAVFVYSAYSAKKEIKRRKREAKKRKLEKLQEENKNEE